jgi:hypothetical protein
MVDDSREAVLVHLLHRNGLYPGQVRAMPLVDPQTRLLGHFANQRIVKALVSLNSTAGAGPHAEVCGGAMLGEQDVLPINQ